MNKPMVCKSKSDCRLTCVHGQVHEMDKWCIWPCRVDNSGFTCKPAGTTIRNLAWGIAIACGLADRAIDQNHPRSVAMHMAEAVETWQRWTAMGLGTDDATVERWAYPLKLR
jgi:hypothetical protein